MASGTLSAKVWEVFFEITLGLGAYLILRIFELLDDRVRSRKHSTEGGKCSYDLALDSSSWCGLNGSAGFNFSGMTAGVTHSN